MTMSWTVTSTCVIATIIYTKSTVPSLSYQTSPHTSIKGNATLDTTSMCLYTSVICAKCDLELRLKKTDCCTDEENKHDTQCALIDRHWDVINYDKEEPVTKASKGDICAACRCKSEAEAQAEELPYTLKRKIRPRPKR